ncbi:MAG TPA: DUF2294 domain-containing protein [Verrucomicrobiae bacterium]|nr:DUF2294 domain-containing protein [Verrucomicrobiae bacterium]
MGRGNLGKLEAEISEAFIQFQRQMVGRGPEATKTLITQDMVIVRQKKSMTCEEKHLVSTEKGQRLVKEMRVTLREIFKGQIEEVITNLTGSKVLSSHGDISTRTGERIDIFILDKNLEEDLKKTE